MLSAKIEVNIIRLPISPDTIQYFKYSLSSRIHKFYKFETGFYEADSICVFKITDSGYIHSEAKNPRMSFIWLP